MAGPRFGNTGGGAAVGNPIETARAAKANVPSYEQVNENARETQRLKNRAATAAKERTSAAQKNTPPKATPSSAENKPPIQPKLGPTATGGTFKFPSDFPTQYFMMMKFGPYTRQAALENKMVDHNLFIMLPMPANLGESFGASYNNVSMGPFMGEFVSAVSGLATSIGAGTDISTAVVDSITNGLRRANSDGTLIPTALSQATKGSEALNLGVNMLYGLTPNPNLAVGFQGVPLRTYSFSWKLAPRSPEESQELINIIFHLKRRMHPFKEGFALRYPDYCNVSVHANQGQLDNLIKFKTSVLVDMKVNYAPNGVPSFFAKTQMPTEIEMALTFHETEIFTRQDFDNIPTFVGPATLEF